MVLGKASPDGTIEICVAGHNPPILIRNNNIHTISATGMPVGLFCEAEYSLSSFILNSGDSLLLYTDGLTEARVNEIEYGEEKVSQVINTINCSSLTPQQILDGILSDHSGWLGNVKPLDDITLLCLKRR
jgi:sigma-B regulation protein RsbU (phosphoserine phosphatase)